MVESKDILAKRVADTYVDFHMGLSNKRKYPMTAFLEHHQAVCEYAEATKDDKFIHREVARLVNGAREYLEVERKRVPGDVLWKAGQMESWLFAGYNPYFEGSEPPGL